MSELVVIIAIIYLVTHLDRLGRALSTLGQSVQAFKAGAKGLGEPEPKRPTRNVEELPPS